MSDGRIGYCGLLEEDHCSSCYEDANDGYSELIQVSVSDTECVDMCCACHRRWDEMDEAQGKQYVQRILEAGEPGRY